MLVENVSALLKRNSLSQHDLAQWCRRSDVWVSQFFTGKRGWKIDDLTRVADLFGLEPYQLFMPGIVETTERRSGRDRRSDKDRRQIPAQRAMLRASQEIDAHRPPRKEPNYAAAMSSIRQLAAESEKLYQRILAEFTENARGQAARSGETVPKTSARVRNARRPDPSHAQRTDGPKLIAESSEPSSEEHARRKEP